MAKTKLTPERQKIIVDYLADGGYVVHACQRAGIHKDTYYEWMKKGETDKRGGKYRLFADACTHACTEAIRRHVKMVEAAGAPKKVVTERTVTRVTKSGEKVVEKIVTHNVEYDWRAAAWWLERRCPKEWGPQDKKVIVESDEPVRIKRGMPGPKD